MSKWTSGMGGGLRGADPQVRRRNEDLPEEEQQAGEKRDHGGDEKQGHGNRRVEAREGPQEQRRDHGADQQSRDGAECDGAADQLGAAVERGKLLLNACRGLARGSRPPRLKRPPPLAYAG